MFALARSLYGNVSSERALPYAEQVYRARLRILGPDHPDTARAQSLLAHCLLNDPARLEEARTLFTSASAVFRRTLPPGDGESLGALSGQARILSLQGRFAESLPAFEELLRLQRRYRGPEHLLVAWVLGQQGEALAHSGRTEQAVAAFEEAVRISGRAPNPGYMPVYYDMRSLLELRRAEAARAGPEAARPVAAKALPVCDQAVTRAEAWLARDPLDPDARRRLAWFRLYRAHFLSWLGRRPDALRDVDRALAIIEEAPITPEVKREDRLWLAPHIARMNDPARALALVGREGSADLSVDGLYNIACVHALAAGAARGDADQARRHLDRAILFLTRAITKYYPDKHLTAGDIKKFIARDIARDEDLAALRSHPDFREIPTTP
jgi:tetratricopeptide (TPR) repeat protein